jgi:hypothetical protein
VIQQSHIRRFLHFTDNTKKLNGTDKTDRLWKLKTLFDMLYDVFARQCACGCECALMQWCMCPHSTRARTHTHTHTHKLKLRYYILAAISCLILHTFHGSQQNFYNNNFLHSSLNMHSNRTHTGLSCRSEDLRLKIRKITDLNITFCLPCCICVWLRLHGFQGHTTTAEMDKNKQLPAHFQKLTM